MSRISLLVAIAATAFIASAGSASAGYYDIIGARILEMGCHTTLPGEYAAISPTCFIKIDQPPSLSPDGCRNNPSLRWDASTLAVLEGAFLAGKVIDRKVSDDTCYAPQPDHPTFGAVAAR